MFATEFTDIYTKQYNHRPRADHLNIMSQPTNYVYGHCCWAITGRNRWPTSGLIYGRDATRANVLLFSMCVCVPVPGYKIWTRLSADNTYYRFPVSPLRGGALTKEQAMQFMWFGCVGCGVIMRVVSAAIRARDNRSAVRAANVLVACPAFIQVGHKSGRVMNLIDTPRSSGIRCWPPSVGRKT